MEEIWKPVVWYEGRYEISNLWRVKTLLLNNNSYPNWWIVKSFTNNWWYNRLRLWINNSHKWFTIHRLVSDAFIPNPENKTYINHKNGIKHDNRVDNLEWVTQWENIKHAYRTWLRNILRWKDSKLSKTIIQYDLNMIEIQEYVWIRYAWRVTWIDRCMIMGVCNWKYKSAWWFIWRYK